MIKKNLRRAGALLSAVLLLFAAPIAGVRNIPAAGTVFNLLEARAEARAAVIRGSSVNVRPGPSVSGSRVAALPSNTPVTVTGETYGADGALWYAVSFSGGSGFVRSDYIKFPVQYIGDNDFEIYLSQQGFPESYKPGLRQLHAEFPNWIFTAFQTGIDWNTALDEEMKGAGSLISTDAISSWKSTEEGKYDWTNSSWPGFDGAAWVGASRAITAYYMDPRNFLDESFVFQFLKHQYNPSLQTAASLRMMLQDTFLGGSVRLDPSSPLAGRASSTDTAVPGEDSGTGETPAGAAVTVDDSAATSVVSGVIESVENGVRIETTVPESVSGGEVVLDFSAPVTNSFTPAEISLDTYVPLRNAKEDVVVIVSGSGAPSAGVSAPGSMPGSGSGPSGSASAPAGVVYAGGTAGQGSPAGAGQGGKSVPYTDILIEAAEQSGVNPYVLAAMILQEQGRDGKGGSISGSGGYYNHFNVGAYASGGMSAVDRGLWYAGQSGTYGRPWNTIEKSIVGGAMFYGENYLNAGQNTLYLKKFNVQGQNAFRHQYMTNVNGAADEGAQLSSSYTQAMKAAPQEFSIPVYLNMPESPCPKPTVDGSPNNKLRSLSCDGFSLTPAFSMNTESYTLRVDASVSSVRISAQAADARAAVEGTGDYALSTGIQEILVRVKAENGDVRQYRIALERGSGGQTGSAYAAPGGSYASPAGAGSVSAPAPGGSPGVQGASPAYSGVSIVEIGAGPY